MDQDEAIAEPCTTQAKRLRHYSTRLHPSRYRDWKGRAGQTLCGNGGMDEERVNFELAKWSKRRIVIAALPECQQCARSRRAKESS